MMPPFIRPDSQPSRQFLPTAIQPIGTCVNVSLQAVSYICLSPYLIVGGYSIRQAIEVCTTGVLAFRMCLRKKKTDHRNAF